MKNTLIIIFIITVLLSCKENESSKAPGFRNSPVQDSLNITLDSIFADSPIVGMSAAIIKNDSVVYSRAFGLSKLDGKVPYTNETIQNIGSISKTFIGVSLLKAQELGLLTLDDPVNKHLPFKVVNPNHPNSDITLRHLATHTSSILDSDYYALSYVLLDEEQASNEMMLEYFQTSDTRTSMEEYLENVVSENGEYNAESFAKFKPGETYEYSNIAATLAALVVEKASGMPFNDFTKKYILTPLKMDQSGWLSSEVDDDLRSRAFFSKDTLITRYQLITYPDGGLVTSTDELALYFIELMKGYEGRGTLLKPESYRELFRKQLTKEQLPIGSEGNTGIFIDFGKRGTGHSGGDPGVLTFMYFDPETKTGKILFCNTDYDENPGVIKGFGAIWKTMTEYENKL